MPDYRLYRLDEAGRIKGPAIEIIETDDDAAITRAIAIDHAHVIEIWSGARLVSCVNPNI